LKRIEPDRRSRRPFDSLVLSLSKDELAQDLAERPAARLTAVAKAMAGTSRANMIRGGHG